MFSPQKKSKELNELSQCSVQKFPPFLELRRPFSCRKLIFYSFEFDFEHEQNYTFSGVCMYIHGTDGLMHAVSSSFNNIKQMCISYVACFSKLLRYRHFKHECKLLHALFRDFMDFCSLKYNTETDDITLKIDIEDSPVYEMFELYCAIFSVKVSLAYPLRCLEVCWMWRHFMGSKLYASCGSFVSCFEIWREPLQKKK